MIRSHEVNDTKSKLLPVILYKNQAEKSKKQLNIGKIFFAVVIISGCVAMGVITGLSKFFSSKRVVHITGITVGWLFIGLIILVGLIVINRLNERFIQKNIILHKRRGEEGLKFRIREDFKTIFKRKRNLNELRFSSCMSQGLSKGDWEDLLEFYKEL